MYPTGATAGPSPTPSFLGRWRLSGTGHGNWMKVTCGCVNYYWAKQKCNLEVPGEVAEMSSGLHVADAR